ncbi:MAG: hypothetical protein AAF367_04235 [Pseudomonadota bacterium]
MKDVTTQSTPPPAASQPVLITVHGTGAGDETAEGERWWQLGSGFQAALGERLDLDPDRVAILPFQWAQGLNSETMRRLAARDLLDLLYELEESGQDYYLIGHSHGGSVIYNALLMSLRKDRRLQHMRQWCTVGTPFLDYRPNRRLWQRLAGVNLMIYAIAIFAILTGLSFLVRDWIDPLTSERGDLVRTYAQLIGIFGLLLLLILYRRGRSSVIRIEGTLKIHGGFSKPEKRRVEAEYGKYWLGLWHQEDEAISALANIRHVSMPIVMPEFLSHIFANLRLVLVVLLGLFLAFDTLWGGAWLEDLTILWVPEEETTAIEDRIEDNDLITHFMFSLLLFGILFLFFKILFGVMRWMARLLRVPVAASLAGYGIAAIINRVIWANIRQSTWGDDLVQEDVYGIAAHPPHFEGSFAPLPDVISRPLSTHSETNAIVTLRKVRQALGTVEVDDAPDSIRHQLSESLNWQELIHTSYFEIPELVDLVAISLHRAGFGPLKPGFATGGADLTQLEDWLDEQPVRTDIADAVVM